MSPRNRSMLSLYWVSWVGRVGGVRGLDSGLSSERPLLFWLDDNAKTGRFLTRKVLVFTLEPTEEKTYCKI